MALKIPDPPHPDKECPMRLARLVVAALLAGAVAAFVASLLRPRRPGGYDPWETQPTGSAIPTASTASAAAGPTPHVVPPSAG